ncbi:alcohol oxidase [Marasmius fiardii PR-910]|nr:alcohol oxidase [Marasmius fiardii PR-910]
MAWYRGSNSVWNNFAKLSGDESWSWDSMEQYYLKTSRLVGPQDGRDITGEADPTAHGNGDVKVTLIGFPSELDSRIAESGKSSGDYNLDYNSGDTLGVGWAQFTTGGGERNSATSAYIHPIIEGRKNLDVLVNTRAVKLYSTFKDSQGAPVIDIVEVASGPEGPRENITALAEVILSAGSINTPQLLLLSGIGPKIELDLLGIPVVHGSDHVGKNLVEHPLVFVAHPVNESVTETFDDITRNSTVLEEFLGQWKKSRTGPLVNSPLSMVGNWKVNGSDDGSGDQSSGDGSANVMWFFGDGMILPPPPTGHFMSVAVAVMSPTSRGSVTLSSTSPFTTPNIDFGIYSTEYDMALQIRGIRMVEDFLSREEFKGVIDVSKSPFVDSNGESIGDLRTRTDEEIESFARGNIIPYFHPVGTVSVKIGDEGVVDSRLSVKGVTGLRVVDASVFPQIPECNTQAPVYILAERAADIVKEDWYRFRKCQLVRSMLGL